MIQIKPDPSRRIDIPGVPAPVKRPVDIDQAITGFTSLRTLRIYEFDEGSVIEGHAEDDEVFIVVLAGAIELTMTVDGLVEGSGPSTLAAPVGSSEGVACAAYLPPDAAYKLIARSDAEVAYVRATPIGGPAPKIFFPLLQRNSDRPGLILEETSYARRLRFRLMQVAAQDRAVSLAPIDKADGMCEALVYVRCMPLDGVSVASDGDMVRVQLDSQNTLAVSPGEELALTVDSGAVALVLVVMAI
jgi:hypothetical protein